MRRARVALTMAHPVCKFASSGALPHAARQLSTSGGNNRLLAHATVQTRQTSTSTNPTESPSNTRQPTDLSGISPSPWDDHLDLQEIYGKVKACRIRQHINPLRAEYQVPREALDWSTVYADSRLPLVLDIGCAGGRFLLALANKLKGHNFLGLDIRNALIERANEWAKELRLNTAVSFQHANATVSLASMLASYPGQLQLATIQFPDPHFKMRHKKRRIVQPQLIAALAELMPSQGQVFLQSDVEDVTAAMRDEFEDYGSAHFELATNHEQLGSCVHDASLAVNPSPSQSAVDLQEHSSPSLSATALLRQGGGSGLDVGGTELHRNHERQWAQAGYLPSNPLGVPTEREVQTLKQGKPVYRVMLVRK